MSAIVSDTNKVFTAANNAAFYGNSFTASGWYKFAGTPADYTYLFGNSESTTNGWQILSSWGNNTKELARVNATAQYDRAGTVDRGTTWNFVALTFNSGANELKLYWGNESTPPTQVGATVTTAGTMGTGGTTTLGFGTNANDGTVARDQKISDFRIYNATVRSEANLQSDYLVRLVGNETGLTDYWKFNDGSGNTAANSTSARNATATAASWDNADDPAFTASVATGAAGFFYFL